MGIYLLDDFVQAHGQYSGYSRLIPALQDLSSQVHPFRKRKKLIYQLLGKADCLMKGIKRPHDYRSGIELAFYGYTRRLRSDSIHHVLSFDGHYPFWNRWEKAPENLVATIHAGDPQQRVLRFPAMLSNLDRLSSAIVLSRNSIPFLETHVGANRVKFVHHGVDTDFFCPGGSYDIPHRLMFVGRIRRNTAMLRRVVLRLVQMYPDMRFDFVGTTSPEKDGELRELLGHPAVVWHRHVSDQALRALYQRSYLLLQPLNKTSANNAVVEALACGLPVVATEGDGITDYGGGTIFPVVPNDDDEAMIDMIERYLQDPAWRDEVATECRRFAETTLAWPVAAREHLDAYAELYSGATWD